MVRRSTARPRIPRGGSSTRNLLSTYQPKKHSKSFTGCWTCRTRKVKCDEGRPGCRQCRRSRLGCEGYDVRLQWMVPETGDSNGSTQSAPKSHRSKVILGPPLPNLLFHEIDDMIFALDLIQPEGLSNPKLGGCGSQSLQCFGVFDSTTRPLSPVREDLVSPSLHYLGSPVITNIGDTTPVFSCGADSLRTVESSDIYQSFSDDNTPQLLYQSAVNENIISLIPSPLDDEGIDDLINDFPFALETFDDIFPVPRVEPPNDVGHVQNGEKDKELKQLMLREPLTALLSPSPPPSILIPSEEKFLMHHYTSRVVHLFCALDNPKSPWKTIHVPRALLSTGELFVQGSTSPIRQSLRNSLLSISAFRLSNDYKVQSRHEEARKWSQAGTRYRGNCIQYLKEAVNSGIACETRPKYKECLATMLSVISINVFSGDTETCGMHLDGAFRLISQSQSWKSKYSSKARALHRIYFYLRTIYQSTLINPSDADGDFDGHLNAVSSASIIPGILPDEHTDETSISSLHNESDHMYSYALIYGVPHSLLVLLNRAVEFVNQIVKERGRSGARTVPPHLTSKCEALEIDIIEWQDKPVANTSSKGTNSEIIEHMTRAFHNAIIIYFAQNVRLLGHHYLQPFIWKVIGSIEAVERIKLEMNIVAAPLYWPAFIAASESFDPGLQERFRNWYNKAEIYGIESVRTATSVLSDVWEQGPCPGRTTTGIWRIVVQRTGAVLLLS